MMKIQESAEHYLETLLILKERNGLVRSIDLANELGYSRPSVSVAVKQFRENGYVTVDEAGYIELTGTGREIAEKMYERHKTLSSLLERMGVSQATAARDAFRFAARPTCPRAARTAATAATAAASSSRQTAPSRA